MNQSKSLYQQQTQQTNRIDESISVSRPQPNQKGNDNQSDNAHTELRHTDEIDQPNTMIHQNKEPREESDQSMAPSHQEKGQNKASVNRQQDELGSSSEELPEPDHSVMSPTIQGKVKLVVE